MTAPQLTTVNTPSLVVDRGRLERNAAAMKQRAADLGVALRPHLKTVKSQEIAALATNGGGAAVSTLQEVSYFALNGPRDLVLAVCVTPDKLDRCATFVDAGVQLTLLTDDLGVARAIAAHPSPLRALVEVDCGSRRTGLWADDPMLVAVAEALGDRGCGVLTHAGHAYGESGAEAIARIAEDERRSVTAAAQNLRDAGLPCNTVSLGSTPTAVHARSVEGATELRPGVYLFMDLYQAAIGCCTTDDIALSVLATVISRHGDRVLIDAGGLALSKDRSTRESPADAGYGLVCDLSGEPLPGRVIVGDVHQEHGFVYDAPTSLQVGDRVRILPNHACMTAAAHDAYHVVHGGIDVVARYGRCNGW
ncbi:MAG: alanine racemase [Myxococcota bacterium]